MATFDGQCPAEGSPRLAGLPKKEIWMLGFVKRFCKDESGAVSVDWVVLTAGFVAFGVAVTIGVNTATQDLSADIEQDLVAIEVGS